MDLTLQKGPCSAWKEYYCEQENKAAVGQRPSAPSATRSRPRHHVFRQAQVMWLPRCPQGGGTSVVRPQPKPSRDGELLCKLTPGVHEQCGTYVCLLNNTKRDLLQDCSVDFWKAYSDLFYVNRKLMFDFFFFFSSPLLPISINMS